MSNEKTKSQVCFDVESMEQIQNYDIKDVLSFLEKLNSASMKITESKDKDYGGSWQKDGVIGVHLNTKRKWDRLHNLFQNGFQNDLKDETVMDTLVDLRNYVGLYIYFMDKKNPGMLQSFLEKKRIMSETLKFTIGDNVIQFKIGDFDDNVDMDRILKIDYANLMAEMITFPVIVNRLGILAAKMDNLVSEKKLDLKIFEAKQKRDIRQDMIDNGEKITIDKVDDELSNRKSYRVKHIEYLEVIKEKEFIYSFYMSAKDKSKKLDKLSLTIKSGDIDDKIIQNQLNKVYFKIKKGRIQ